MIYSTCSHSDVGDLCGECDEAFINANFDVIPQVPSLKTCHVCGAAVPPNRQALHLNSHIDIRLHNPPTVHE